MRTTKVTFGTSGFVNQMVGEQLKVATGVNILHVPFKGGGPAMIDVIGGHTKVMFSSLVQTTPHIKSGKLRALGTGGLKRNPVLPDVPTIAEAGVPGYEATIWLGVVAPKGTPPAIVNRLNAEITKITGQPDVKAEWAKQGAVAMTMTPEAFGKYMSDDVVKWERIVKISGAQPDK